MKTKNLDIVNALVFAELAGFTEFESRRDGGRLWRWKGCSRDQLFKCLVIQEGTSEARGVHLNMSCIVHFFQECPSPPGVFGVEFNVLDILIGGVQSQIREKYVLGLDWLRFAEVDFRSEFQRFLQLIRSSLDEAIEDYSRKLSEDAFRRQAYEYFTTCADLPNERDLFMQRVARFGEPAIIQTGGPKYSSAKAATQLFFKSAGRKRWAEV